MTGFRWEYEVPQEPDPPDFDADPVELSDTFDLETVEYTGDENHSEQLWREILDRLDDAAGDMSRQHQTIILGRQTAAAVDAWIRYNGGSGIEAEIPAQTLVTVPGRMIHIPERTDHAIAEGAREGGRL